MESRVVSSTRVDFIDAMFTTLGRCGIHLLIAATVLCAHASAQSVISVHAGLVHFSEGVVSIDDRMVTPVTGRFPEIPEGSLFSTEDGRAEILLGPDVFLWLDRN